ncbi:MAG: Asp-tRNA(Asn)/Glu-tRNA(Gln) amidotransferase subunit GatC [bacterium]
MIKLDEKVLLKLAKLSALKLSDNEIPKFTKDLNELLKHFEELNNIKSSKEYLATRNKNIFRQDKAIKQNSEEIMAQAPKTQDNYFVVPSAIALAKADKSVQNKKDN